MEREESSGFSDTEIKDALEGARRADEHMGETIFRLHKQKQSTAAEEARFQFEELTREFARSAYGIAMSMMQVGIESLASDGVMTSEQTAEFLKIGSQFSDLGLNMLTGEKKLEESLREFGKCLKLLSNFFSKNPEVAIKIGATILESIHPAGRAIKMGLNTLLGSSIGNVVKEGLVVALKGLTSNIENVESSVEEALERKSEVKRK